MIVPAISASAATLLRQTLLELKLLFRLRWPLLFPPAAFVWMLFQLSGFAPSVSQNVYRHLIDSQSTFHTLSLGLPLLLGILLVRRDVLNPSFEWIHSLPVSNAAFMLSKFAAGIVYMTAVTLFVDAAYLLQAGRAGLPAGLALQQLRLLDLTYLWSYGISIALGMTIGTQLPSRFALPIGFCAWVFGTVFLQVFIVERNGWYVLKAFYLNHLLSPGPLWNELWGASLAGSEYGRLRLFVAVFGLFLLIWSTAALRRERPYGSPRAAAAAALLALLAACAAFVPYAQLWNARFAHLAELRAAAPDQSSIRLESAYAFKIDSLALELYRLPDDEFRAAADLAVPTVQGLPRAADEPAKQWTPREDGRLTFLLYPALQVTAVTVNGRKAPYIRRGDRLSVSLAALDPEQPLQHIRIAYAGKLDEWNEGNSNETYMAFLKGNSIYLPAHLGWYPLPGGDSLLFRDKGAVRERPDAADSLRADIDVRLHGFEGPLYATIPDAGSAVPGVRHFSGANAQAFTLIGGDGLTEVRKAGEPVSVVTTAANRNAARQFLAGLSERRSYYAGWLGRLDGSLSQIMYLPDDPVLGRTEWRITGRNEGGTVLLSESMFQPLDRYQMNRVIAQLLFGDDNELSFAEDSRRPSLVQEVRRSILNMYDWERYGDRTTGEGQSAVSPVSPDMTSPQDRMDALVTEAAAHGKMEQAKQTLRTLYEKGLSIGTNAGPYIGSDPVLNAGRYPVITWEDWNTIWKQSARENGGKGS